jgi:hypothetical protein
VTTTRQARYCTAGIEMFKVLKTCKMYKNVKKNVSVKITIMWHKSYIILSGCKSPVLYLLDRVGLREHTSAAFSYDSKGSRAYRTFDGRRIGQCSQFLYL